MKQVEKIGLIIGVISAGERRVYTSESAQHWERYYIDPRSYLKKISNNDNSTFVDFVCYGDGVALYFIHRSIDGRPGDAVFGMITIPSNVVISGEELEHLINQTREELAKTEYSPKVLDDLFNKEYELKKEIYTCHSSFDNGYFAYQKYGNSVDYHLYELLDKNLFSSCYNGFKAVFLINDEDDIVPYDDVIELRQEQVESYAVLKYPVDCECRLLIEDAEFTEDYPTKCGCIIDITVEKKGYQSQTLSINIDAPYIDISSKITELQWDLIILKKCFNVRDSEGKELLNTTIKFNGTEIIGQVTASEAIWSKTIITIESDGYEIDKFYFANVINELKSKGKVTRILKKAPKTYTYILNDIHSPNPITFSRENANYNVNKSPLACYEVYDSCSTENGEQIYLREKSSISKKILCIILVVMFVTILLSSWGGWKLCDKYKNSQDTKSMCGYNVENLFDCLNKKRFDAIINKFPELSKNNSYNDVIAKLTEAKESSTIPIPPKREPKTQKDIKVLLNNSVWKREDFIETEYLELFDAVNSFNYDTIISISNELIKLNIGIQEGDDYKTWNRVITMCNNSKKKQFDTPFSNDGQSIDLSKWLQKVAPIERPPFSNLLLKTQWVKTEFSNINSNELYQDLKTYNFQNIIKYKEDFKREVQDWLTKVEKWEKDNKKKLQIQAYDDSDGIIKMWPWLDGIEKAIKDANKDNLKALTGE